MTTHNRTSLGALAALVWMLGVVMACVDPPGGDDDASVDDDDAADDDDDVGPDSIGIAVDIVVNYLDEEDWPSFVATVDGAEVVERAEEPDLFRVPADGDWHSVVVTTGGGPSGEPCDPYEDWPAITPDCYMHAQCDVRVQGDQVKVRVTHYPGNDEGPPYSEVYEYVSDFGHWDGNEVEFEYDEGDTLVVPMNYNPSGEWGCVLGGVSEHVYWVDVEYGERGANMFSAPVYVDGHRMVAWTINGSYDGMVNPSGSAYDMFEDSYSFACVRQ
ncbi:hypothetical protein A3B32_02935 [Candidatus Uhrbacteria bacterium RIFCSPLOWO2_01_FULL_53_9]|uniref:Uncharacterized protein n=2 Tax=Candidatus Uhriibacteriota TaxID=1752732 RepID=A0A1F7UZY1_9BACT|nr:MAG: hypothetical protein A3B32_02935 [Candidatus Uhrbacteria bacterium RIFCSPLOWO2_01_FULL_53_9]